MKNPIAERITDFLKHYPPFSSLSYLNLLEIAKTCQVIYLEKNQTLFKINDATHSFFYVVASCSDFLKILYANSMEFMYMNYNHGLLSHRNSKINMQLQF